jgi:hypothetical protein
MSHAPRIRHSGRLVTTFLQNTCVGPMLADMHNCTWDEETRSLTTDNKALKEKVDKAFESAVWFKDEFGVLGPIEEKIKLSSVGVSVVRVYGIPT